MNKEMAKLGKIGTPKDALQELDSTGRRATRKRLELPVHLKVPSVESAVDSKLVNISKTGMFIATQHPPAIGTLIDIELELPDGKLLIHATGKVVRHESAREPPGIGVQFENVSYEAQELIDQILDDNP